ncbi:MAG: hypothetical protein HYY21_00975 [Candidatus Tectomicrobia bacterium]|nr:hypothetical protein [Candidatus Tectomicrobia bacterium]
MGHPAAAEVRARAIYPSADSVPLVKLAPVSLTCQRGPFRLEVSAARLASVEVRGGRELALRFPDGETCVGGIPERPLSGEWSHGDFKEEWRRLRRVEIVRPAPPETDGGSRYEVSVKGRGGAEAHGVRLRGDAPLEVRKGAFRFEVPWAQVRGLRRAGPGVAWEVSLADGGKLTGTPPEALRGEWRGGVLTVPWDQVVEVTPRGAPKGPAETPGSGPGKSPPRRVWGAVLDDTGTRVQLTAPPEFDGPFSLWDPVQQVRDRTLLPLARGDVTYLIAARAVAEIGPASGQEEGLYRVAVASGKTYSGSVGKGRLRGRSPQGGFEIPLLRVKALAPAGPPAAGKIPPGIRAVLHLTVGDPLVILGPAFFYERNLLPDWRESGTTWTGGYTKGFLFVRLGKTVQRVNFEKLSRIEVPPDLGRPFTFVSRDGSRLALRVDWDSHRGFEDLMGVEQWHKSAEAYALAHRGLLGWAEPGVRVHAPWTAIRAVDLEPPPQAPPPLPGSARQTPGGR